jgi:hypothetical protein
MNFNFDLAPGKTDGVNIGSADFFAVVFCPGDLEIKLPGGTFTLFGQGDSYTMPPGEFFTRLEVKNPSIVNTTRVVIYAGLGRYEQRRQSVIEPATEFSGSPTTSLAGGSGIAFDGITTGNRIRRKSINVSNLDPAAPLQLRDINGTVALIVPAGHSITLPVSQYIELYNPGGSAVSFAFNEIWWTL